MAYNGEGIIRRAGMNNGTLEIELKTTIPPIIDWKSYTAPAAFQKEYLAIALIALTSNRRVFCSVSDDPQGPWIISKIGLVV